MMQHIILSFPAVIFGTEARVRQIKDGTKILCVFPTHITSRGAS